jgi:DNA-binding MarR family transcriptional regulator
MKAGAHDAREAWPLLVKLFLAQRTSFPALATELKLSPAQCHVLRLIEPDRPLPMRRLAEALACHASNVTGLVDRLESRGLIRRDRSAGDRRVRALVLTASGAEVRAVLLDRMMSPPSALERLTLGEQRALVQILRRLLQEG